MKALERRDGLLRSPKLAWDILARGRYRFVYDMMDITVTRMSWAKRLNLFCAGGNLLHRRPRPWSMPLHMQFEVANYCNLRCPVCPTGVHAVTRPAAAMDVNLFERVVDEVGPYLLTASLWAWGEPLLHPELEQILRAIRRHDIAILLSTNGQRLHDDRVIEALTNQPPTYLIVAIDGITDETNARFRAGARLAPALEGVRRIAEFKRRTGAQLPILHMRFIVMKHNQHEVPQLEEFARRHHFDLLTVRTLSIIDTDSEQPHLDLVPDAEELKAYDYQDGSRVVRDDFICQEPFWFPTLFADGTVVACEQDYNAQQPMGRIDDVTGFGDIWTSERAARVRRHIRDHADELSFCVNCPYRDREGTDVSVRAHVLNADIDFSNVVGTRVR